MKQTYFSAVISDSPFKLISKKISFILLIFLSFNSLMVSAEEIFPDNKTLSGYPPVNDSFANSSEFSTNDSLKDRENNKVSLKVIDSYIELHSGPGRGYPIIHTIEQDEEITVHRRRGNWYFVSDRTLHDGWIPQEKLARTIAPSGLPAALPEIHHGDFLAQKWRIGFSAGQQDDDETAHVVAGFRLFSFASIEAEVGQIFGDDVDGQSYGANILIEPIKSLSFTPFISHGYGKQVFQQKEKLNVGRDNNFDSDYRFTGAGVNFYIGLNFVVRGEYRKVHINGKNGSASNSAWRLGFSSFF